MADYPTLNPTRVWSSAPAATEAVVWAVVFGEAEITTNDTPGEGKAIRLSPHGIQAVEVSAGKVVHYRALSAICGLSRNGL